VEPHSQPVRNGADAVTGSLLRSTAPVFQLFPPALGTVVDRTTALPDLLAPVAGGLRTALAPTQHLDGVASAGSDGGRTAWVGRAVPGQDPQVSRGASDRSSTGSAARPVRAARPAGIPDTRQVPGSPERTPVPAYPDSGNNGISTMASGSHHDGGASATVPAPVAGGQLADLRRPCAAQVAVRPLLAEVPTVAPD